MSKAKKTIVLFCLISIFVCLFGFVSVSAESEKHTVISIKKNTMSLQVGNSWTDYKTLTLNNFYSPMGGTAYLSRWEDPYYSEVIGRRLNSYFSTSFRLKRGHKYVLNFYISIPWSRFVNTLDNNPAINNLWVNVCNTNREYILRDNYKYSYYEGKNVRYNEEWKISVIQNEDFAFFPICYEFVSDKDTELNFINYGWYNGNDLFSKTSLGYFGVSDIVITEYQSDSMAFKEALDEYTDEQEQMTEEKRDEAVADVEDVLEDVIEDNEDIEENYDTIIDVMTTDTLDCSWTFPEVSVPSIGGIVDGFTLIDEQEIDFGFWISKIPPNVLKIVQICCTIALIIFCFKECYSLIQQVMLGKGGNE